MRKERGIKTWCWGRGLRRRRRADEFPCMLNGPFASVNERIRSTRFDSTFLDENHKRASLYGHSFFTFFKPNEIILMRHCECMTLNVSILMLLLVVTAVTVFQETSYYRVYRFVGWGCPVVITLIWAIVTALYYHPKSK